MNWIIPENKLDDQQREFVDNVDINRQHIWIKGFPGSGKSVLLAYVLKKIRRSVPDAKVVVVVFTHSLISMFRAAFKEMGISVPVMTYYQFVKSDGSYDYVLCDEVQDFVPSVLRTICSKAKHVVASGDENQSIYDADPRLGESTISPSQISSILSARVFELGIIHRLSRDIINVVHKFLPNMNIFSSKADLTKESTQVRLCKASDYSEEVEYIMRQATNAVSVDQSAAILLPQQEKILAFANMSLELAGKPSWNLVKDDYGRPDYDALNSHLKRNGIPMQYVGSNYGSFSEGNGLITLMTYHSSKGLDFDNVFLPGLNRTFSINRDEDISQRVFMVAMTRSRLNLYITYNGVLHSYVDKFASDCHSINIHDSLNSFSSTNNSSNPFDI